MMLVDARGKLGGHVFTKVRSGNAIRTKVTPTNRKSYPQSVRRNFFAAFARQWSTDPNIDRVAWNEAALNFPRTNVFGDTYAISGKNLYISLNANLILAGADQITEPPFPVEPPHITTFGFGLPAQPGKLHIVVELDQEPNDNANLVVAASRLHSLGRFTFQGQYRILQAFELPHQDNDFDLTSSYENTYGPIEANRHIGVQVWVVDPQTGIATSKSSQIFKTV